MTCQKLESLERMLDCTYNENLGLRLEKGSAHYNEIARMVGNRQAFSDMRKILDIN